MESSSNQEVLNAYLTVRNHEDFPGLLDDFLLEVCKFETEKIVRQALRSVYGMDPTLVDFAAEAVVKALKIR